jgi:transposase
VRSNANGVSTAAGPAKVIERSAADASVLAHVVVSRFADRTPLHRQHRICDHCGVHIPVSPRCRPYGHSKWTRFFSM